MNPGAHQEILYEDNVIYYMSKEASASERWEI